MEASMNTKIQLKGSGMDGIERLILTVHIGLLTLLKNGGIGFRDACDHLYNPYSVKYLRKRGVSPRVIDLILLGCELEDYESLMPDKLHGQIDLQLANSITAFGDIIKSGTAEKWIEYSDEEERLDTNDSSGYENLLSASYATYEMLKELPVSKSLHLRDYNIRLCNATGEYPPLNNIYALNRSHKLVWIVSCKDDIDNINDVPFVDISITVKREILATDAEGIQYTIAAHNGNITKKHT